MIGLRAILGADWFDVVLALPPLSQQRDKPANLPLLPEAEQPSREASDGEG